VNGKPIRKPTVSVDVGGVLVGSGTFHQPSAWVRKAALPRMQITTRASTIIVANTGRRMQTSASFCTWKSPYFSTVTAWPPVRLPGGSTTGCPAFRPAIHIRLLGPLLKKRFISRPMRGGFNLPQSAVKLLPGNTDSVEGLAALEQAIERLRQDPTRKALQEGAIVGLANHTILIAKNGTERPSMSSKTAAT
jgi:hypothetical protein